MQDLEVKDKLDNITPLSAGIVFGKEDAWDKLQGRLDSPPTVIAFPYRLTTIAASLLALVGIVYYFVQNGSPAVATVDTKKVETPQPPPAASTETTVVLLDSTPARPIQYRRPQPPAPAVVKPATSQVVATDTVPTAIPPTPEPPSMPVVKMKVVHINEIGKRPEPESSFAGDRHHLNYKNMKVFSIHELNMYEEIMREETQAFSTSLQTRPTSFITLPAPLGNMQQHPAEAMPRNPISIRLNRNN